MKNATANENAVMLDTPLKRGDTLITEIEIIRPNAGTLRGVRLALLPPAVNLFRR